MVEIHLKQLRLKKNLDTLDKGGFIKKILNADSGFDILFQASTDVLLGEAILIWYSINLTHSALENTLIVLRNVP